MASDGQATYPTGTQPLRAPVPKIYPIHDCVLSAYSGDIGLAQKARAALSQGHPGELKNKAPQQVRKILTGRAVPVLKEAMDLFVRPAVPHQPWPPMATLDSIFAFVHDGKPYLLQVDRNGVDTLIEHIAFLSIGSGDIFAFADLRRRWPQPRDVARARVVAYRVIRDAIEVAAFGLGMPIDIWTLGVDGRIENLESDALTGVKDTCELWCQLEAELDPLATALEPPPAPATE